MGSEVAGTKAASRSRASRVRRGLRAFSAEFGVPPREFATGGVLAGNPVGRRVDVGRSRQQRAAWAISSALIAQAGFRLSFSMTVECHAVSLPS